MPKTRIPNPIPAWFLAAAAAALLFFAPALGAEDAAAIPEAGQTAAADDAEKKRAEDAEKEARREQERQSIIEQARVEAETIDEELLAPLPSAMRGVLGYRILGATVWRIAVGAALLAVVVVFWFAAGRYFAVKRKTKDNIVTVLGGWHLMAHVALLALKNPLTLLLSGLALKLFAVFIVTRFHPEILWISNILIYLTVIVYLYDLTGLIDAYYGARLFRSPDRLLETVRPLVFNVARAAILLVGALHIYQSITGQTLVSIVAGLGIGGLALALASQETLKNLLGFASIAMDQPFLVGDLVTIGKDEGTVEKIGMRSMRIRTADGACVILPNATAIASNVLNKARRPFIRQTLPLYLHPANGIDKIEHAILLAREALQGHNGPVSGMPPVVRLEEFQPGRLVVNAYFWFDVKSEYDYFEEAARLNLEIYRRLSDAGVIFAER